MKLATGVYTCLDPDLNYVLIKEEQEHQHQNIEAILGSGTFRPGSDMNPFFWHHLPLLEEKTQNVPSLKANIFFNNRYIKIFILIISVKSVQVLIKLVN